MPPRRLYRLIQAAHKLSLRDLGEDVGGQADVALNIIPADHSITTNFIDEVDDP